MPEHWQGMETPNNFCVEQFLEDKIYQIIK